MIALTWLGFAAGYIGAWCWRFTRMVLRLVLTLCWRTIVLLAAASVLLVNRRWAMFFLGMAVSGHRRRGRGGTKENHRTPDTAPLEAKFKPVPAQRIATGVFAEQAYFTKAFDGPALLEMLVGPAGVGKTEVKFGQVRDGFDGVDFVGLPTSKCKRILLLTEMGNATLKPALRRWGFYETTTSWKQGMRLRYLPPRGYAGGLIDVVYAADVYKPRLVEGVMQETDWAAVIRAIVVLVEKGRYDRVIVDSLGEWMGADNNEAMLKTLGACRQVTNIGAGVTVLHHTPRSDPHRPRGGTVIEAKLDIGWWVTGTGNSHMPKSRQDSLRKIGWFKTRFPDDTPPDDLIVERVWGGPESGIPRYRLVSGDIVSVEGASTEKAVTLALPVPKKPDTQQQRVLDYLEGNAQARGSGATVSELALACGISRQRVNESLKALTDQGNVFQRGARVPERGGKPAALYLATSGLLSKESALWTPGKSV